MGCCCNNDPAEDGDCAHVSDLLRSCQKWYGSAHARDTVDGALLAEVLGNLTQQVNRHSTAFSKILRADCTLKDKIILCRHLADEIGVSCLIGRGGDPPPAPTPPQPEAGGPILDFEGLSSAYGGWSLRRLLTDYEGPLIRVRRALDNEELDVYAADDGYVDTSVISEFAGGSDVFVHTIYDQVVALGHTHDLIQTVPGQQGQIYDAILGFVTNSSGALAIDFDGSDDTYSADPADLVETGPYLLMAVAIQPHVTTRSRILDLDDTVVGGSGNRGSIGSRRPNDTYTAFLAKVQSADPEGENHSDDFIRPYLLTAGALPDASPASSRLRVNGAQEAYADDAGTASGEAQLHLGSESGSEEYYPMFFSEFIYFDGYDWSQYIASLNDTIIGALEDNMMATWGITPAA